MTRRRGLSPEQIDEAVRLYETLNEERWHFAVLPVLDEYHNSTPFITLEGMGLFIVLDERLRLDDLLRRKKRYANETGDCYFPASKML